MLIKMPIRNSLQHRIEHIQVINVKSNSDMEESRSDNCSSSSCSENGENASQGNDRLVCRVKSYPKQAMNSNGSFS